MLARKTISVAAPILNEQFFIQGWLKCVSQFADELVITDGGSKDGTISILLRWAEAYPEILTDIAYKPQTGLPYSDDWNEGAVRNDLLLRCTKDYILLLDADEYVTAPDLQAAIEVMETQKANRGMMKMVPFWDSLEAVRINSPDDEHWHHVKVARLARKGTCRFNDLPHHCPLTGTPVIDVPALLYHFHYAFGPSRLKQNDNRRYDFDPESAPPEHRAKVRAPMVRAYSGPWPDDVESIYPQQD